jgi:hypothetical protein
VKTFCRVPSAAHFRSRLWAPFHDPKYNHRMIRRTRPRPSGASPPVRSLTRPPPLAVESAIQTTSCGW